MTNFKNIFLSFINVGFSGLYYIMQEFLFKYNSTEEINLFAKYRFFI